MTLFRVSIISHWLPYRAENQATAPNRRPAHLAVSLFSSVFLFSCCFPLHVFASAPDGHQLRLAASSPARHIPEARCLVRSQHQVCRLSSFGRYGCETLIAGTSVQYVKGAACSCHTAPAGTPSPSTPRLFTNNSLGVALALASLCPLSSTPRILPFSSPSLQEIAI